MLLHDYTQTVPTISVYLW